jgi:D-aminopeptidase
MKAMHAALRHMLHVTVLLALLAPALTAQTAPPRIFISVDMEGVGGIGTSAMTSVSGKDYATGRRLVTDEVNAVTDAIFARHPDAEILVNDSHGDHQNVLHLELDPRVTYIQGSIKPLGMVQGLDASHDGAIFIGYHAMAGDAAATRELGALLDAETVTTKTAETPASARLLHPEQVHALLGEGVGRALDGLSRGAYAPLDLGAPVTIRMRFASTTHVDVLQSIPGMSKVDGFTVAYTATNADEAYRLIRLMYRFVTP